MDDSVPEVHEELPVLTNREIAMQMLKLISSLVFLVQPLRAM